MLYLNSDETNSIAQATQYYDCAGLQSAQEKTQEIANQNVVVMTQDELRQIVQHIKEYDTAMMYGEFAPPVLPFWSQLQDLTK